MALRCKCVKNIFKIKSILKKEENKKDERKKQKIASSCEQNDLMETKGLHYSETKPAGWLQ